MSRFDHTAQPDWDWWSRLWPTPGATLRRLGLEPGDSVAELGCGDGYFALPAARIAAPAPVYAVDIDPELLTTLRNSCLAQGIENVHPIATDLRTVGAALPASVDVALVANTMHGIRDPTPVLQGVADCLSDGGRFVVINWRAAPPAETPVAGEPRGPPAAVRLAPDESASLVREALGLEPATTVPLAPHHYAQVYTVP
jgi:SAM-dependent methyltransferase